MRKCTSMAVHIIPYMLLCTFLNLVTILGYKCYTPISIVPHYPPPGKCQERMWRFELYKIQIHHLLGMPVNQIPTLSPPKRWGLTRGFAY